jgi:hypothetical protein
MTALLDLARDAELEVRRVAPSAVEADEPAPASAVCRVRGRVWVVLSSADPVAIQLGVLGAALRDHASELVASRYVAPAVRAFLEPD